MKALNDIPEIRHKSISQHPLVNAQPQHRILELGQTFESKGLSPNVSKMLYAVRNINRLMFEKVEHSSAFTTEKTWVKDPSGDLVAQGGGVMTLLRGKILEKAAVNCSIVAGDKYPSIEHEYKDKPFLAAGVSLICHPLNPNAPIAHMNVRVLKVGQGEQTRQWIGGGADLTPMVKFSEDTQEFHKQMEDVCLAHPKGDYQKYRKWCDEYFLIPHYQEPRGVGGIFFDYLTMDSEDDLDFLAMVGEQFARVYGRILERRVDMPYDAELKDKHLHWRGRYAEFNLAYDRGTRFGLMSGGNVEAIFASLPPTVKW
jgi:coproporphyrinogen III oxidase